MLVDVVGDGEEFVGGGVGVAEGVVEDIFRVLD